MGGVPVTADVEGVAADGRGLDSGYLADLLRAVEKSNEPSWMAVLRYASRHKLRIVLASALLSEGHKISPGLEYEVSFWRRQVAAYDETVETVRAAAPGMRRMKGGEIGALYPADWVRDSSDVDLVAESPDEVWAAARQLRENGWSPDSLAVQRVDGRLDVALNMVSESADEFLLDHQAVEMVSAEITGDAWRVRPASRVPGLRPTGPARQVLALLEEGFERSWLARDLLDASLLLMEIGAHDVARLLDEVALLGLGVEWDSLARSLRALGLVDDELCPVDRAVRWRSAARRAAYGASLASRPAGVAALGLQRWQARRAGPLGNAVERRALQRVRARAVLEAGLPLWGVRTGPPQAADDGLRLEQRADGLYAATPVGTFLLVYVKYLDPDTPVSG